MNYKRLFSCLPLVFLSLSCGLDTPDGLLPPTEESKPNPPPEEPPPPDDYTGSEDNTFDHMSGLGEDGSKDPMEVLADRKSTRLNSSHVSESRMPSSA